ncbi:hypothetical protein DYB25_009676 [Aphanomyces astaci]|uniref:RanBD1 domain-containing protein n=2 Tax=Aphanomyces astaci TaxID=112090 RepID=A0A397AMN6_APHAT|nr:hypothetical protein DYB25_009676 [Aphanomyces astaci]
MYLLGSDNKDEMSEYGESFEEFVDEESIGDADDNTMRRSRSRSPSRPLKPLAVPAIHESSYGDESFEAATSTSPSKAMTTSHIATHLQPVDTLVKFPLGSVVEVYWPDEKEWFTGAVRHYDTTHGYFDPIANNSTSILDPMNVVGAASSPGKSPHAKSPLNKRPRVNTEGHDGIDRGQHDEEDVEERPVSPSKKTDSSPREQTTSADVGDKTVAPTSAASSTGFAAFAGGGFGTSSSTGFGFGSGGFGRSSGTSGFGSTSSSTAASFGGDKTNTDEASAWTDANDTNADFLNAEADKVEVQHLVVPKVELPKDYHHVTGEENEHVLLQTTAKLFKLVDKEYVECGAGPLKVLEPKDKSTRGRLVMRRATSDFKAGTQLLLNALLTSIPSVVIKGKNAIVPVLTTTSTITTYCIRLESPDVADKLQQLLHDANK